MAGNPLELGLRSLEWMRASSIARAQPRLADLIRDVQEVQPMCRAGANEYLPRPCAAGGGIGGKVEHYRHPRLQQAADAARPPGRVAWLEQARANPPSRGEFG